MANPEHVEIVKQGAKAIEEWRESNPKVRLDLVEADLRDLELRLANLMSVNLKRTDLEGAILAGSSLRSADLRGAIDGKLYNWQTTPHGSLAFIILTDQFSRNMFRDIPESFAQDALALSVCRNSIEQSFDTKMSFVERAFLYMPLEHSEDVQMQALSLDYFGRLPKEVLQELSQWAQNTFNFAKQHAAIIERFGRYPHRNDILGRDSSEEELAFLNEPDSSF